MSGQTVKRADIPLPGGGEAVYSGTTLEYYRHADHPGSSRLASTPTRGLYSSTAYAPYGDAYDPEGTADASFTGKKHDIDASTNGGPYDLLERGLNPVQGHWCGFHLRALAGLGTAHWSAAGFIVGGGALHKAYSLITRGHN